MKKLLPLFIVALFILNASLYAQKTKQTKAKVDSVDNWVKEFNSTSDSYGVKKTTNSKDDSLHREETILMFMSQFDSIDMGKWALPPQKNYGSPMADSFALWLYRLQMQDFNGIDKPNATPILGADKMDFYNGNYQGYGEVYEDGAYIQLKYLRSNKNSEKVYKKVKKAFNEILKDPAFLSSYCYDAVTYNIILQNSLPVLDFSARIKKDDKDVNYLYLSIQYPKFPKIFIVDEAKYKGSFPTSIQDNDAPQIWEEKGNNNGEWYQRYNGIFKDGILIKGSKTFKGYGDFYDGTWYSKEWGSHSEIVFFPANSKDTVWGHFNDADMNVFGEDNRYSTTEKHKRYKDVTPAWVTNVYANLYTNQKEHARIADSIIRKSDESHLYSNAFRNMQQAMLALIDKTNTGFEKEEAIFVADDADGRTYYAKLNPDMLADVLQITQWGNKTAYRAFYHTYNKANMDMSLKAFLSLPSIKNTGDRLELIRLEKSLNNESDGYALQMNGVNVAFYVFKSSKQSIVAFRQIGYKE